MSYRQGTLELQCDMDAACTSTVTMIDDKGYVYCTRHGIQRRDWRRCRKLRPHELARLRSGKPLAHY